MSLSHFIAVKRIAVVFWLKKLCNASLFGFLGRWEQRRTKVDRSQAFAAKTRVPLGTRRKRDDIYDQIHDNALARLELSEDSSGAMGFFFVS